MVFRLAARSSLFWCCIFENAFNKTQLIIYGPFWIYNGSRQPKYLPHAEHFYLVGFIGWDQATSELSSISIRRILKNFITPYDRHGLSN